MIDRSSVRGRTTWLIALVALAVTLLPHLAHADVTTTGDVEPNPIGVDISGQILFVGRNADGTLLIDPNTAVNSQTSVTNMAGFIGVASGTTGAVTVTGTNSTWTNTGALRVGSSGAGTLKIEAGGAVSNTTGSIGLNSGSTGTATVTGANSLWDNSAALFVGLGGTGTLKIEAGGTVSNSDGFVGDVGTTGVATVTGTNSTWANGGQLHIGTTGTGILSVENGGAVSNGLGFIGLNSGSTGTATVTGAGSTWTNSNVLIVGDDGSGTLNIENGGAVSNTGNAAIGLGSGSTGTATVAGAGSTWANSSSLSIGGSSASAGGTGALNILDSGSVEVAGVTKVWGAGTVNLNGGTLTTGSLEVLGVFDFDQGTLNLTNSDFTVGPGQSFSTLSLQPGTILNVTNGTGNVAAGGNLFISGSTASFSSVGGTNDGVVSVAGSQFTSTGAYTNNNQIDVVSGATLDVQKNLTNATGGQINLINSTLNSAAGTRFFTDLSAWQNQVDSVEMLDTTAANVALADEVSSQPGVNEFIGPVLTFDAANTPLSRSFEVQALQTAAIGAGFTFNDSEDTPPVMPFNANFTDALSVGDIDNAEDDDWQVATQGGPGLFAFGIFLNENTVEAGEKLDVFGAGDVLLGSMIAIPSGDSVFIGIITDQPITRVAFDEDAGGDDIAIADFHFGNFTTLGMTNQAGATISAIGSTINLPGDGVSNDIGLVNEGTMTLVDTTVNGDVRSPAGSTINVAGTVIFNGLVSGDVNISGPSSTTIFNGGFSPGDSPADFQIAGDVTLGSANTLFLEIGGNLLGTEYDHLDVAGMLTVDGILDISLLNGFAPQFGDTFDLLDFGSITGSFSSILLPGLSTGLKWETDNLLSAGIVEVVPELAGDFDIDGDVDGADFLLWQRNPSVGELADWESNYGSVAPLAAASTAVPEPGTAILLAMGGLLMIGRRRGAYLPWEKEVV